MAFGGLFTTGLLAWFTKPVVTRATVLPSDWAAGRGAPEEAGAAASAADNGGSGGGGSGGRGTGGSGSAGAGPASSSGIWLRLDTVTWLARTESTVVCADDLRAPGGGGDSAGLGIAFSGKDHPLATFVHAPSGRPFHVDASTWYDKALLAAITKVA